ncbi:MAG: molybdopterin-binding protein [Acidobacteria bacterium]|nr:molybdopterin-binding protein [Acidobacteriota bacterium]
MLIVSFVFSIAAQTAAKTESVLRVEVEGGKTLELKTADLAKFARRDVRAKGHDEKESVYSGYNLADLMLAAGAKIGKDELKGREMGAYLVVEAADGYRATFSIAEFAPEFSDKVILLADTRDGKPLDSKEGPWQMIVPDDKKHGRWVRQVTALKLKKVQ